MKTQEEFYLANQVDGKLTDAQAMQLLSLPEGDTATPAESSVPAAAAPTETPAAPVEEKAVEKPTEPTPVIVAKDGVHTIPYEKLTEAREAEQHWKRVATEQQQQLEALAKAPPAAELPAKVEPAQAEATGDPVFGDFSEEAIAKGVERLVSAKTAAIEAKFEEKLKTVLDPIQKEKAESATEAHFSAINKAHPDVESIVQSAELGKWIDAQPSFARAAYKAAIEQGTAVEVIEALDAYKAATGKLDAAPAQSDAAAAAQAAIAKAQSAPPMSLSELPAGSAAHHDQAAAMLEMSSTGVMSMFDGKTPEQINALMNRVL